MREIIYVILVFFAAQLGMAQVGIGIEVPEASLDVNVQMKAKDLPNVSDKKEEYNRVLYADANGYLGYRILNTNTYVYRNSYFAKMDKFHNLYYTTDPRDLELSVTVPVPPMKKLLIELSYSVAVMNGDKGNASIMVRRQEDQNPEEILDKATRAFTFVDKYSTLSGAKGRAISNMYYDEIENDTDTVKNISYKIYGVLTDKSADNKFGMWSNVNSPESNFNWGRGSLNVNVFEYEE